MSGMSICRVGRQGRQRRGFAAIYVALLLFVIMGFVAFGVDIGRMQLAKTELQGAADAAARAAVFTVRTNRDTSRERAVAIAAANTCSNQSVKLYSEQDIEFGHWSAIYKRFTPRAEGELLARNAVRVTSRRVASRDNALPLYFAAAIGHDSSDVQSRATVMMKGGRFTVGIVGIDYVEMNGITTTDSYDPGPDQDNPIAYAPETARSNGDVTSNGEIELVGQATINGIATYGPEPAGEIDLTSKATITGDGSGADPVQQLSEPLEFPPVDPQDYALDNNNSSLSFNVYDTTSRDFGLKSKWPFVLKGGETEYTKYLFRDFIVGANANLVIEGKVEICVTGQLKIAGSVQMTAKRAGDFRIRVAGEGAVDISGDTSLYADIYAPEAPVTFNGLGNTGSTLALFGTVIGKSLTFNGSADVHYDESLGREISTPITAVLVE